MIEALNSAATATPRQAQAKDARSDTGADAPFSLALAAAALEARAGASLKAFGGAPAEGGALAIGDDAARPRPSDGRMVATTDGAASNVSSSARADAEDAPAAAAKVSQSLSTSAHPGDSRDPGSSERPIPAVAGMSGSGMNAAATPQTRLPEAVAARETSATRALPEAPKAMRAAAPRPAQQAQEEFARLLARRLDSGASRFDIRLNPSELGRVEARLTVADDGKATLALNFDNQAALDLFARDEAALRAAIAGSGFQFGAGDLAFTLERRDAAAPAASASLANIEPPLQHSVEPLFFAPFTQGVIDLRV